MIRIALVGCGNHARESHAVPMARFVKENPGQLELVAACDVDPLKAEQFCRDFGFAKSYTNVDALLAGERLDACALIVPPATTGDLSVRMLEAHMPCIVEKPLGANREAMRRMVEVAHRTGTPHMVSVNRRFMPRLNRGLTWAREQGPIHYVRATMCRYNRHHPDFFWGTGLHALDAVRHIAGDVAEYSDKPRRVGSLKMDWHWIDLRFTSGATGRLEVMSTTGQEEETYELHGEAFCVRIVSYMRRGTSIKCWLKNQLVIDDATTADEPQDVYRGEYEEVKYFVATLSAGQALKPSIADIAVSQEICFDLAAKTGAA